MNDLSILGKKSVTMSSLEIAKLTAGKSLKAKSRNKGRCPLVGK